jgi:hypothetical protein
LKIIITESQFVDLFFKRRFGRIDQLVDEKMRYYPPCDYTYDPYYAFYDYFGDVRNAVIFDMVEKDLNLTWEEENMVNIDEFSETTDKWMYEIFFDKVREYYDKVLEDEDCDE